MAQMVWFLCCPNGENICHGNKCLRTYWGEQINYCNFFYFSSLENFIAIYLSHWWMFCWFERFTLSKVSSSKDALGVPRGPCRMCHRCPGLPGFGLLRWPQLEEEVLEMGENTVVSKALGEMGSRCRRCDCPGHQHQNLEQWLGDVKKRCKEMRLIVSCWA